LTTFFVIYREGDKSVLLAQLLQTKLDAFKVCMLDNGI